MEPKFAISNQILNTIYEFSRIHTLIYSIHQSDDWVKQIRHSLSNRSGLAAVSIDSDIPKHELLEHGFKIPKELQADKDHYIELKNTVEDVFKEGHEFNTNMLKNLQAKIIGVEKSEFRKEHRILPKVVNQDGVYVKVLLPVKTKPNQIQSKLENFIKWLNSEAKTINPIILAGLTHLKVIEIHAFDDGNGRLARLCEHGILYINGIDKKGLLPIEEYYLRFRERYYSVVEETIKTGDMTKWLEFFSQALLFSANQVVEEIFEVSGGTIDIASGRFIETTPKEKEVIDIINNLKQASGADIARLLNVSRQNINVIATRMIEKGIIKRQGSGSNLRYYLNI